jgi:hypothetical protein
MPGYTRWTEHGEYDANIPVPEHAYDTVDGLDEMLADLGDAMNIDEILEDEPTANVKRQMNVRGRKLVRAVWLRNMPRRCLTGVKLF